MPYQYGFHPMSRLSFKRFLLVYDYLYPKLKENTFVKGREEENTKINKNRFLFYYIYNRITTLFNMQSMSQGQQAQPTEAGKT